MFCFSAPSLLGTFNACADDNLQASLGYDWQILMRENAKRRARRGSAE